MGQVGSLCPNTGYPVPLGVEVSSSEEVMEMLDDPAPLEGKVDCPHCGRTYDWSKVDVLGYLNV